MFEKIIVFALIALAAVTAVCAVAVAIQIDASVVW